MMFPDTLRTARRMLGKVRRLVRPLTPKERADYHRVCRVRRALDSAWSQFPRPRAPLPTVYVLTAHQFNHVTRPVPLDPRLVHAPKNFQFYFFDPEGPPRGFRRRSVCERDVHPQLHEVGKRHLAEWTFFLAEYERPFARYPFAAISSRFYDKNTLLTCPLEMYLPAFGHYLREYGYGYLPSYDRPFSMINLEEYSLLGYLGTRREGVELVERLYGVRTPDEYKYTGDFWCNYVAFNTRKDLERYVEFYLPLIRTFFDEKYNQIAEYADVVVNRKRVFRNEKPLTLFLEQLSHLYFYRNRIPYFGLHYDGFYEVDEANAESRMILPFGHTIRVKNRARESYEIV